MTLQNQANNQMKGDLQKKAVEKYPNSRGHQCAYMEGWNDRGVPPLPLLELAPKRVYKRLLSSGL